MIVLIISDIHANLIALEAVLSAAGNFDEIWNLGDTVGYGPRPRECLALVRNLQPSVHLAGNHDLAATGDLSIEDFNPVARIATIWTAEQLTRDDKSFLRALPSIDSVEGFVQVHGSPRHPVWEYVTSPAIARDNFSEFDEQACFLGHSHVQLYWSESAAAVGDPPRLPAPGEQLEIRDERYIINPGSVGQPRDRNPSSAFAMFDTKTGTVTFRRARYDIVETQTQMEQSGLPAPLVSRLTQGV